MRHSLHCITGFGTWAQNALKDLIHSHVVDGPQTALCRSGRDAPKKGDGGAAIGKLAAWSGLKGSR